MPELAPNTTLAEPVLPGWSVRILALAEVSPAFALMHVAFRAFKRYTSVGQMEWKNDVYRTPIYGVLAFIVALAPYVLAIVIRERAMHWTGVVVGVCLLVGAAAAMRHARATWQQMQSQRTGPQAA